MTRRYRRWSPRGGGLPNDRMLAAIRDLAPDFTLGFNHALPCDDPRCARRPSGRVGLVVTWLDHLHIPDVYFAGHFFDDGYPLCRQMTRIAQRMITEAHFRRANPTTGEHLTE